jgi:hypothetical protein
MNRLKLPIKERNFNETTIAAIMEIEAGGGHVCRSLAELLISLARVGCAESMKRIKLPIQILVE